VASSRLPEEFAKPTLGGEMDAGQPRGVDAERMRKAGSLDDSKEE